MQFALPLIFLGAAAMSAIDRHRRRSLHDSVTSGDIRAKVSALSWQQFELLIGEAFRRRGYRVIERAAGGADGGVDVELRKGSDAYLVQCKQWKAFTVGVPIVRELLGVLTARRAAGGFVVTSGAFTQEARKFAAGQNIELIDGGRLAQMLKDVSVGTSQFATAGDASGVAVVKPVGERPQSSSAPQCPKCGAPMVKRKAKSGPSAGHEFWGCSTFPKCRGISPLPS
ncbi:MAG: restriction endonuclease [Steroidobacteraceae bacterium]